MQYINTCNHSQNWVGGDKLFNVNWKNPLHLLVCRVTLRRGSGLRYKNARSSGKKQHLWGCRITLERRSTCCLLLCSHWSWAPVTQAAHDHIRHPEVVYIWFGLLLPGGIKVMVAVWCTALWKCQTCRWPCYQGKALCWRPHWRQRVEGRKCCRMECRGLQYSMFWGGDRSSSYRGGGRGTLGRHIGGWLNNKGERWDQRIVFAILCVRWR